MAIYHLHASFVSRSTGRTSVQSVAYICGEKLHEDYRGKTVNFTKRANDIAYYNTIIPEGCKYSGLSIWNEVENFENRYANSFFKNEIAREKYRLSAQTAQMFVVALPHEISMEANKKLVEQFVRIRFLSRHLFVTYAIHKNIGNLHAHIQVSRRAIAENGDFNKSKDRGICTKLSLSETRSLWANLVNEVLFSEGFVESVTEKSFETLGMELEATKHEGWYAKTLGMKSRIVRENLKIIESNKIKILSQNKSNNYESTSTAN